MTLQVQYLGKIVKDESEKLPVPGIPQPFAPGETRVFDDGYLTALGVDPKNGEQWVRDTFAYMNQNRPENAPLFVVEEAKKKTTDLAVISTATDNATKAAARVARSTKGKE